MAYLFVLGSPIDHENFLGQEIIAQANAFIPKIVIGLRSESRQAEKRGKRRERPAGLEDRLKAYILQFSESSKEKVTCVGKGFY